MGSPHPPHSTAGAAHLPCLHWKSTSRKNLNPGPAAIRLDQSMNLNLPEKERRGWMFWLPGLGMEHWLPRQVQFALPRSDWNSRIFFFSQWLMVRNSSIKMWSASYNFPSWRLPHCVESFALLICLFIFFKKIWWDTKNNMACIVDQGG